VLLDLDYYKLTMLQFVWKHYADLPVRWRMHSRNKQMAAVIDKPWLEAFVQRYLQEASEGLSYDELLWLHRQEIFEPAFIGDLDRLFRGGLAVPRIEYDSVTVEGTWFGTTLWETLLLASASTTYSANNLVRSPDFKQVGREHGALFIAGAKWADFGTRRRYGYGTHVNLVDLARQHPNFVGTSNVQLAMQFGLQPIGTYAHELEMVLRNWSASEAAATNAVLYNWREMYPPEKCIALTDTYGTIEFFRSYGRDLLDEGWTGVRLDSGDPFEIGGWVEEWCSQRNATLKVVFSDGLNCDTIIKLHNRFKDTAIEPMFGWGTGFTNPNSDLSLVMKAVESNGLTYKVTDDEGKAIR
jgi:nicotinate phosphoribosyltransferase